MNNKKVMQMKRLYKEQEGVKKLEEIYYVSTDIINDRFRTMTSMLDEILELANISLVKDTDDELKSEIYNKHEEFNRCFDELIKEMKMIKTDKHHEIENYISEYKKMYFKIILRILGKKSSKSERSAYVTFLVASEIIRYRKFISDYIYECFEELSDYYDEVDALLNNNKEDDVEEELYTEDVVESQHIEYVSKAKDLEKLAKELGYVFKSCNGSHKKYENTETHICVTIPVHGSKDIKLGLSKAIQKQLIYGTVA